MMKHFLVQAGQILLVLVLVNFMAYMLVRCIEDETMLQDEQIMRRQYLAERY